MTAIVTGGTKGIGRSICDILIQNGMNISVCSRNSNDLKRLKLDYEKAYPDRKPI